MATLPFQTTTVPVNRSISQIMALLNETGFNETAQYHKNGETIVWAKFQTATFQFSIHPQRIVDALIQNASRSRQRHIRNKSEEGQDYLAECQKRAQAIGWRALFEQVKATCDAIRLGALEPAEAFGGQLVYKAANGEYKKLASEIALMADRQVEFTPAGLLE